MSTGQWGRARIRVRIGAGHGGAGQRGWDQARGEGREHGGVERSRVDKVWSEMGVFWDWVGTVWACPTWQTRPKGLISSRIWVGFEVCRTTRTFGIGLTGPTGLFISVHVVRELSTRTNEARVGGLVGDAFKGYQLEDLGFSNPRSASKLNKITTHGVRITD